LILSVPQRFATMSFEHEVYRLHSSGQLDNSLMEFFLPNGEIRPFEGPMWDYKVGFVKPDAVIKSEAVLHCDLLKDIAAMYNAFGGYLIIAFTDDRVFRGISAPFIGRAWSGLDIANEGLATFVDVDMLDPNELGAVAPKAPQCFDLGG
jgi:hypothetical protein